MDRAASSLQQQHRLRRSIQVMISRRLPTRVLVLIATLAMVACGGGFSLYIDGSYESSPPSVSLAAAQTTVRAGETVRLVAAASDESGIESVAFYRLDGGSAVLLGADGGEPFEWAAVAPDDGRAALVVFARATDGAGNRADSDAVSVTIVP